MVLPWSRHRETLKQRGERIIIIIINKPDIIIRDNEKGTYMLIYVAISGDRNVIKN